MRSMQRSGESGRRSLGIYLHVPFCVRKCLYCDFLSAPGDDEMKTEYVEALKREIRGQASLYGGHEVRTVFFGGGTPSLLSGEQIGVIMECLREEFSFGGDGDGVEVTMEVNPGTVTRESLSGYRLAGVNRLSMGLQSADDRELKALGRIHTWEDFLCSYEMARKEGFGNINVDLMSALPGQSPEGWAETLEKVIRLKPEHISAYSLIIEEGTPFFEYYGKSGDGAEAGRLPLPTEDEDRVMYGRTKEILGKAGYGRYEISNYALSGFACRHNISYWERIDYAGFGVGAASLLGNVRWSNTADMGRYLEFSGERGMETHLKLSVQKLSVQEQMEEFMFLGLRMTDGVSARRFYEEFGESLEIIYAAAIDKLVKEGLLVRVEKGADGREDTWFRLTDFGIDVSNYALSEFLFD